MECEVMGWDEDTILVQACDRGNGTLYSVKAEVFRDKSIDSSLIKVSSFELVIYVRNIFFEEINLWFIQLIISLLSSLT